MSDDMGFGLSSKRNPGVSDRMGRIKELLQLYASTTMYRVA